MLRGVLASLVVLAAVTADAAPQRAVVQRGTGGAVSDCYIWQEAPTYNGNSDTLYVGLVGSTDKRAFLQFDLAAIPSRATVLEARLALESTGASGVEIRVHEVNAPWTETSPTWETFADSFFPAVAGRFIPVDGRNYVDLTALVQQWVDGRENNGLMLEQDTLTSSSTFQSSDAPVNSLHPALEVLFDDAPLVNPSPLPTLAAACGVAFSYPLRAQAPAATQWSVDGAPDGLALDAATGTLKWTPVRASRGDHVFSVTASDGRRSEAIVVTVTVECAPSLQVGCAAAPGGALGLLAALWLMIRRRR